MAKDLAIVLNNGGVNSAVATALAQQKHRTILLYADAGRPEPMRRGAFEQQAAHFKPYREHVLEMPFFAALAETRSAPMPAPDPRHPTPLAAKMLDLLPLVACAGRFAAHYGAVSLYLGLRIGNESRGANRSPAAAAGAARGVADELAQATEYVQIWSELLEHPCGLPDLVVETPLLELEPWQVIDLGFQVNAPFDHAWSCDEDGPDPCWACPGCARRDAAFQQAAKPDPLHAAKRR